MLCITGRLLVVASINYFEQWTKYELCLLAEKINNAKPRVLSYSIKNEIIPGRYMIGMDVYFLMLR